ncbi:MAG: hypothetical protein QOJ11_446, partial [Frankiales bacterium]|nr:hypothetical protein [Frankiales bacterium]
MQVRHRGRLLGVPMLVALFVPLFAVGPARATILPTVAITAPAQNAFVQGQVEVTAVGEVDPAGSDNGQLMHLFVDGQSYGSPDGAGCPTVVADPGSCPVSFGWDTS